MNIHIITVVVGPPFERPIPSVWWWCGWAPSGARGASRRFALGKRPHACGSTIKLVVQIRWVFFLPRFPPSARPTAAAVATPTKGGGRKEATASVTWVVRARVLVGVRSLSWVIVSWAAAPLFVAWKGSGMGALSLANPPCGLSPRLRRRFDLYISSLGLTL